MVGGKLAPAANVWRELVFEFACVLVFGGLGFRGELGQVCFFYQLLPIVSVSCELWALLLFF